MKPQMMKQLTLRTGLAGTVALAAAVLMPAAGRAAQLPSTPGLNFQTSAPFRCATIGDWYTTLNLSSCPTNTAGQTGGTQTTNAERIHRFSIAITAADIAANGGSVTIRILDAESNGARDEVDGNAIGVAGTGDPTRFQLFDPSNALLDSQTVPGTATDGTTVTFPAITQPGIYTITSVTGSLPISADNTVATNDDDNGFIIDVPGIDDLLIGQFQGTFQQDTGAALNLPLYFLVGPGTAQLRLRNFDLDGGAAVSYVSPDGTTTTGTASRNGVWNGSGGNLNTGQDAVNISTAIANPLTNDYGVWQWNLNNYTNNNQTLLQANSDVGELPLFDARPRIAGNFTITPDTLCSVPPQPAGSPPDSGLCTGPTRNTSVDHPFTVTNNFFTNDIINLALPAVDPNYTVQLLDSNGTALTDSDSDGVLDTGILTPGQSRNFILRVTPNPGATVQNTTVITGTSFMDRKVRSQANNGAPVPQSVTKVTRVSPAVTLGDTIFLDTNGNGVQDTGENGISGVTVTLLDPGPNNVFGDGDDASQTTTTNGAGQYSFNGVSDRNYRVTVTLPAGFTLTTTQANLPAGLTLNNLTISGPPGQQFDFGLRGGSNTLGDTVFNDVSGNGVQDGGETGISGVTVTLTTAGADGVFGTADDVTVNTTTTTALGNYSFPNLPNGTYRVTVTPPAGGQATTPLFFDRTLNGNQVANDADFGFRSSGVIGDQVFVDLNSNGQPDANEFGVSSVAVRLISAGPNGTLGDGDDVQVATTTTDAGGRYSFEPPAPGNYRVTVTPPAGFTATTPANRDGAFAANQIDLTRDFGLRGPARIGETVFTDTNGNGIQDPGEPGVPGVTVQLRQAGPNGVFGDADDVIVPTTTSPNGTYQFMGLPRGNYQVTVVAPAGSTLTTPQTVTVALTGDVGIANFGIRGGAPGLRLVKRITNVTRNGATVPGFDFNAVIDDPATQDDNAPGWSQIPLRGQLRVNGANTLRTGDEITYTVYYLVEGASAFGVNLCDQIPDGTSFIANTNQIQRNNTSPSLGGTPFSALAPLPVGNACQNQSNPNGSVLFNLGDVPNTTGNNFGFVRFRARIN